jgi:hypothetical protein
MFVPRTFMCLEMGSPLWREEGVPPYIVTRTVPKTSSNSAYAFVFVHSLPRKYLLAVSEQRPSLLAPLFRPFQPSYYNIVPTATWLQNRQLSKVQVSNVITNIALWDFANSDLTFAEQRHAYLVETTHATQSFAVKPVRCPERIYTLIKHIGPK